MADRVARYPITRRSFLQGSGLALTAAALAACGGAASPVPSPGASGQPSPGATGGKRGGTLRVALGDGNSGDSLLATRMPNFWTPIMFLALYDPIIRNDNGFQPNPGLAESWEPANDAKSWIFRIRKGVTFHDGTPLTAKDVAYSLKFVMREEAAAYTGSLLRPILNPDNITVEDDHTMRLDLDKKFVFVPNILGLRYSLVFKEGTTDDDLRTKNPVGTGPFKFKEFTAGQSFAATRNEDYWDEGKPYVDELTFTNIPESASKVEALTADQVELIDNIDFALVSQLKTDAAHEPFPLKDGAWQALVCDLSVEPFNKPGFVRAMKLGVDRQQSVDTAYAGLASIGFDGPIPGSDPYFPADLKATGRDVAAAKEALKEAGYPNGIDLPFDLVTVFGFGIDNLAAAVKEQLAEVGIRFNIRQGGPTFWDTVYLHEPFYIPDWNRRHPFEIYGLLTTTENMTNLDNAELKAALDAAASTTDFELQKSEYAKVIKITAEQDGYVLPAYGLRLHAKARRLQGVRPNLVSFFDFTEAYFE